ncbi:MAG: carboxymuconolactone decarboxylase family protein [Opitutae bacterium]|nr:carboxymuconolactone decarboxylase family protein [Opitutae bacterium]
MTKACQTTLPLLTPTTVSAQGAPLLEGAQKKLGFVPNMYGAMVNSPGLLETCMLGYERFRGASGFSRAEQEVVFLTISFENGCDCCMAAHSFPADNMSKVPKAVTGALRAGTAIPDVKLAALAGFTRHLLQTHGRPTDEAAQAFIGAGFTERQILEVILALAVKTLSNYSNHIFGTPVDDKFKSRLWTPPAA